MEDVNSAQSHQKLNPALIPEYFHGQSKETKECNPIKSLILRRSPSIFINIYEDVMEAWLRGSNQLLKLAMQEVI
jgi:hypothetical protein